MSRIKSKKYIGVYLNKLKNGDVSYSINYKDLNNKKVWFTVGKKSDGITEIFAYNKRSEFINLLKLGEEPPSVLRKKKKQIITIDSIAMENYNHKEKHNRNNKVAKRKYEMHISPVIGNYDIKTIAINDLEKLQTSLHKKFAPKTVNNILGELSTIFSYAMDKGIVSSNLCKKITSLKVDNISDRYLSLEEIDNLLEYVKEDEQVLVFILLALTTGARVGALTKLTPRDINFKTKTINMLDEKNNERYTAFLSSNNLQNILKKRIANIQLDTPILKENDANLYYQIKDKVSNILNKLFNENIKSSKHKVVIHTLRHTFASHLAINGTPIFTIQKLLNHKDINMTLRYAKLSPDSGRKSVEKLGF